jgi:hypothetical protein
MLVLWVLACAASPVVPKWISVCDASGPHVTCVNADSVTYTADDEPRVICHWSCAELGDPARAPDDGPRGEPYESGLDLVFELDDDGICYVLHAHEFEARCDGD